MKSNKLNKSEFIYIIAVAVIMMIWCIVQKYNYAPDEYMRYFIPKYIFNHGKLPLPNNPEVVADIFNASYAYYPLLLPALISSCFMKVTSIFTINEFWILISARMTSVISGIIFIYFMIKGLKLIIKNEKARWIGICFLSLIPQFIFLSSYVNNDSLALAASSIIVYSWICGLKYKWNYKNCLLLSLGIILNTLSYYNSYGWTLFSIIIFIYSYVYKENKKLKFNYREFFKYGLFIALIVLVFTSFFFIRNAIINHGDMLGINSFLNACENGAIDYLKPSLRSTPENMGLNYIDILTDKNWIKTTYTSFIATFGYMQYRVNDIIYIFYLLIIFIGLIGYIIGLKERFKEKNKIIFDISLIFCIIIPILLSLKYSYSTDYQPQGRYVYPMYLALGIILTSGYENLLNLIRKKYICNVIVGIIISFMLLSLILSTKVYIFSL